MSLYKSTSNKFILKYSHILFITILSVSCSQKKPASIGETAWQIKMNKDFKDASKSPLKAKDLKTFEGLNFYAFDSSYIVKAKLEKTPDSSWFNMKTSTDRFSKERVYAIATFELKGKTHQLNIYQGEENLRSMVYKNFLLLPFLDHTNGASTYGGGRYLDLHTTDSTEITIDFNKAYNPYCAYNEKYSCPIVPRNNSVDLKIEAGVKKFKD